MTDPHDPSRQPHLWSRRLLRHVLPCEAIRDSIFGDLHEEFVRDRERLGPKRARAYHRDRVLEILLYAVWDTLRLRTWTTVPARGTASTDRGRAGDASYDADAEEPGRWPGLARPARLGGMVGLAVLGLAVLVVGIVVNTSLFAAVNSASTPVPEASLAAMSEGGLAGSPLVTALGIGSVALMLACAIGAALVMCRAPGWRPDPDVDPPGAGPDGGD